MTQLGREMDGEDISTTHSYVRADTKSQVENNPMLNILGGQTDV